MDLGLLYFSIILLGGYAGLRQFTWREAAAERKKVYGLTDLRNMAGDDSNPVRSAYWTRDLIQIIRKS